MDRDKGVSPMERVVVPLSTIAQDASSRAMGPDEARYGPSFRRQT
jgi:hypothetical protein